MYLGVFFVCFFFFFFLKNLNKITREYSYVSNPIYISVPGRFFFVFVYPGYLRTFADITKSIPKIPRCSLDFLYTRYPDISSVLIVSNVSDISSSKIYLWVLPDKSVPI